MVNIIRTIVYNLVGNKDDCIPFSEGPVGSITMGKTNGGEYAHGYVKKETDKWTASAGGR